MGENSETTSKSYLSLCLENIHKVIDELFLDDLQAEFAAIKTKKQLRAFHDKIANIKIFDPACGSGNFLTESYLSLRRIENELLKRQLGIKIQFGELVNPIKISIANFYGIEINDFAVAVAQTALWIAELQMMQETQAIIHRDLNFLPLKSYANIQKANALLVDWKKFAPEANYIIGNPPFVGKTYQTTAQKNDLIAVDKKLKPLDYVTGWYFKAIDFMKGNSTRTAFLSTNSITQGEQVGYFWQMLGGHIDFAHRTFSWDSESTDKAHVHCVVIGFSVADNPKPKKLFFDKQTFIIAKNINGYLMDFDNIYVEKRDLPLFEGVPLINQGNSPIDNGNFLFTPAEMEEFIKKEPLAAKFIRQYVGAEEFINGKLRYCLWLVNATPAELRKMKLVYERIQAVKDFRLASKRSRTLKSAETPALFAEIRQPTTNYILVPRVSSERRKYIPMGFMSPEIIVSDAVQTIPNATLYDFGILTSSIHMGWMRTVAGRLKSDYRYSATIVYNNFIWAAANSEQKARIEASAGKILEIRARYQGNGEIGKQGSSSNSLIPSFPNSLPTGSTLADLYDELTMPADLRRAHRQNDLAVAKLYGFEEIIDDEGQIVRELLRRYAELTKSPEK